MYLFNYILVRRSDNMVLERKSMTCRSHVEASRIIKNLNDDPYLVGLDYVLA